MKEPKLRVVCLFPGILLVLAMLACSAVAGLPTSAATSMPTASLPPAAMSLKRLPGGSIRLTDPQGGFSMDIPSEWTVVPVNPDDLEQMMADLGDDNPILRDIVERARQVTPGTFPILAFKTDELHSSYASNFNVGIYRDELSVNAPMDELIKISVENTQSQMPGAAVRQLATRPNAHGVRIGAVEGETPFNLSGTLTVLHLKQYYFQTETALVVTTLLTHKGGAGQLVPAFDKLFDGIQLFTP